MACRKAAYRAETQMSEWMVKQQEEAAEQLSQLEEETRKRWTPTEILDTCCMSWLRDGPEILGIQGRGDKGCSGTCGYEKKEKESVLSVGTATAIVL